MRVDKKAIFTSLDTQWHLEEEVAAEKKKRKGMGDYDLNKPDR